MKSKWGLAALFLVIVAGAAILVHLSGGKGEQDSMELAERTELPLGLEGRPAPPLEVDLDRQEILRIFPVRTVAVNPPPRPEPGVEAAPPRNDQDALEEVTSRWVYVSYANLAGVPIGGFRYNTDPKLEHGFEIREGEAREGVTVYYLDSAKAMARYGDATIRLPRIDTGEIPPADRSLVAAGAGFIPDSTAAWQRYWELYGKLAAERAKNYTPAPWEHMPPKEPLTREEIKRRADGYVEFVGQQIRVRKEYPRYRDVDVSTEAIRKHVYRQLKIDGEETAAETPPEGESTESPGAIRVGQ